MRCLYAVMERETVKIWCFPRAEIGGAGIGPFSVCKHLHSLRPWTTDRFLALAKLIVVLGVKYLGHMKALRCLCERSFSITALVVLTIRLRTSYQPPAARLSHDGL